MAGMQDGMITEILSEEFFALGKIRIEFWQTTQVDGKPKHALKRIMEKNSMFSLQGADELRVQKAGFSDLGENEYFVLYLKDPLPIYNAAGNWFKIIVDGNEYILRRSRPWRAYYSYWVSRAAKTLNPF